MEKPLYDLIGSQYSSQRKTDPRIQVQINGLLKGAKKILNVGAGTGSYEPKGVDLIALEPSTEMIKQRNENAYPVIKGTAESLPFESSTFSHIMTILSMHHWADKNKAFNEINRVGIDFFVALTWNPKSKPFWLTRDYFPEIHSTDIHIFPLLDELDHFFTDVSIYPLLIPDDCQDGFLAAYWKRPEFYLKKEVRNSISSFSKINDIQEGLTQLEQDLQSGSWYEKNRDLHGLDHLDAGYTLIKAKIRK